MDSLEIEIGHASKLRSISYQVETAASMFEPGRSVPPQAHSLLTAAADELKELSQIIDDYFTKLLENRRKRRTASLKAAIRRANRPRKSRRGHRVSRQPPARQGGCARTAARSRGHGHAHTRGDKPAAQDLRLDRATLLVRRRVPLRGARRGAVLAGSERGPWPFRCRRGSVVMGRGTRRQRAVPAGDTPLRPGGRGWRGTRKSSKIAVLGAQSVFRGVVHGTP